MGSLLLIGAESCWAQHCSLGDGCWGAAGGAPCLPATSSSPAAATNGAGTAAGSAGRGVSGRGPLAAAAVGSVSPACGTISAPSAAGAAAAALATCLSSSSGSKSSISCQSCWGKPAGCCSSCGSLRGDGLRGRCMWRVTGLLAAPTVANISCASAAATAAASGRMLPRGGTRSPSPVNTTGAPAAAGRSPCTHV